MSRDWHRDLISPVRDRGGLAALLNRVGARLLNIERAPGVIRRVQPVIVPKLPGLTQPAVTPPTLAPLADARASIGGGGSTGYITRIGQGGLVNAGPDIAGPAVILFAYWSEGAGVTTPSISCSALTVDFALIETIDYTETSGIGSPSMDANMSLFVGIVGMGDTLPSGTVLTISPTGIVWSAGVYAAFGVDIASVVVQSASASDDSGATSLINTLAAPASANNLIFSALSSVQGLQLGTTSLAPGTYIEDFLLANGAGPDSHGSRQAWGYEAGSLPGAPSQTWTVAAPNPVDDFDTGKRERAFP